MNSRRMLANSRSFAQKSRRFQGKKPIFEFKEFSRTKHKFKEFSRLVRTLFIVWRTSSLCLWRIQSKMWPHPWVGLSTVCIRSNMCIEPRIFYTSQSLADQREKLKLPKITGLPAIEITEFQQVKKFFKKQSETQHVFLARWMAV